MSEKIVQLNEEVIKGQLKELVRGSVEEIPYRLCCLETACPEFPPYCNTPHGAGCFASTFPFFAQSTSPRFWLGSVSFSRTRTYECQLHYFITLLLPDCSGSHQRLSLHSHYRNFFARASAFTAIKIGYTLWFSLLTGHSRCNCQLFAASEVPI